jgi:hypothetical protein
MRNVETMKKNQQERRLKWFTKICKEACRVYGFGHPAEMVLWMLNNIENLDPSEINPV